jgi:hypothetical protein
MKQRVAKWGSKVQVAMRHPSAAHVRLGSRSCKNPHGLGYQGFIEEVQPASVGSDYALIATISG